MSPDEKYMLPNFHNAVEDMNFVPLLEQLGLKDVSMGWIPVFMPKSPMPIVPAVPVPMPSQGSIAPPSINGMTNSAGSLPQFQGYMNSLPMNGFNNVDQSNATMMQALRDFDLDLDEETDLSRSPSNQVDNVLREIERNNPGALSLLQAYKIPYPIIRLMVRRIIKLTLDYCNNDKYGPDDKYGHDGKHGPDGKYGR